MEFEIGDIVLIDGDETLKQVSGVIHDDNRLFVSDYFNGSEIEVSFSEVDERWRSLDL